MEKKFETNNEKRENRKRQTAEVFTPSKLINEMLDKMPDEVWEEKEDNNFLDPSCGNGNFLVWVLLKKIRKGHDPSGALKTLYGLDIMKDNIKECRRRLLKIISIETDVMLEDVETVFTNIRFIDSKKIDEKNGKLVFPDGSLDYDMSFRSNTPMGKIEDYYNKLEEKLVEIDEEVECYDSIKEKKHSFTQFDIFDKE
jgi:type I restriction-modification system DNA methylase subunit